ncbi:MAG: RDD family protein [Desulfovibrionales bacterium]
MISFHFAESLSLLVIALLICSLFAGVYVFIKIITSRDHQSEGQPSFERRTFASLIDIFLVLLFTIAIMFLRNDRSAPAPWILTGLTVWFVILVYLPSRTGWSPGKLLAKIMIVDKTLHKTGFLRILHRETFKLLLFPLIVFLEYFWRLLGRKKLSWHDRIAGTRVLPLQEYEQPGSEASRENVEHFPDSSSLVAALHTNHSSAALHMETEDHSAKSDRDPGEPGSKTAPAVH